MVTPTRSTDLFGFLFQVNIQWTFNLDQVKCIKTDLLAEIICQKSCSREKKRKKTIAVYLMVGEMKMGIVFPQQLKHCLKKQK